MLSFYLAIIDSQEDKDLFAALYAEYKGFMFHVANKILNDPYMAENIVHDAFIRMIENLDKFNLRNGHKTKGLIGIIVDGLAKNEYRRRGRFDSLDEAWESMQKDPVAIEEQVIEQEQYEKLKSSIYKLNSIYANTLLLRFDYHYSIKEIAEITGVSEDNVRQRLHRARIMLKGLLVGEGQSI